MSAPDTATGSLQAFFNCCRASPSRCTPHTRYGASVGLGWNMSQSVTGTDQGALPPSSRKEWITISWSGFSVASKPPLGLSVAVLAGMALAGGARAESPIPGPPPGAQGARASVTGTGVLVGQTIDGVTGRPISGALVAISATPGNLETLGPGDAVPIDRLLSMDFGSIFAGVRQALTDDQGRFAFTSLPKGSFSLTATKPGWLGGGYSQRSPGGSGAPVVLGEGERVGNITLQLWRNAAI